MRESFVWALQRFGQRVRVMHGAEETETRAFLQVIREKGESPPRSVTALGEVDGRRWEYIGAAETEIAVGDRVLWEETAFFVRQAEEIFLAQGCVYRWAMLERETGAVL